MRLSAHIALHEAFVPLLRQFLRHLSTVSCDLKIWEFLATTQVSNPSLVIDAHLIQVVNVLESVFIVTPVMIMETDESSLTLTAVDTQRILHISSYWGKVSCNFLALSSLCGQLVIPTSSSDSYRYIWGMTICI